MDNSTSSAEPQALIHYADTAARINNQLLLEANHLSAALQHFAVACTEYRLEIDSRLSNNLRNYVGDIANTDKSVRQVGQDFQNADLIMNIRKSFINADKAFLGIIASFAGGRTHFRNSLLAVGRTLNRFDKPGYITKMENLYKSLSKQIPYRGRLDRFLRGKFFQHIFLTGIEMYLDYEKGEYEKDLWKIAGVNITNAVTNQAISATKAGLVVQVVNGLVQIGLNTQVIIQRVASRWIAASEETHRLLEEDTNRLDKNIERMDVDRITKRLSETYYDTHIAPIVNMGKADYQALKSLYSDPSAENAARVSESLSKTIQENQEQILSTVFGGLIATPMGRKGLWETLKVTGDVADGWVDGSIAYSVNNNNYGIALQNKIITTLPMPQSFKDHIDRNSQEQMRRNQRNGEIIINLSDGIKKLFNK